MIARAIAAGVPFGWVAADSVYGVGDIEHDLRQVGKGLCTRREFRPLVRVLGQAATAVSAPLKTSQRRSNHPIGGDCRRVRNQKDRGCMTGATSNWRILRRRVNDESHVLWTRGLLIRRNIANGDLAYFSTWCRQELPLHTGQPWRAIAGRSRIASKQPRRVRARP